MALNNLVLLMLTTLHAIPLWKKRGAFEFFTLAEWIVIQLSFLKPWVENTNRWNPCTTYVPLTALLIYDSLVAKKNNTDDDSSTHGS